MGRDRGYTSEVRVDSSESLIVTFVKHNGSRIVDGSARFLSLAPMTVPQHPGAVHRGALPDAEPASRGRGGLHHVEALEGRDDCCRCVIEA
jgi:hypothetical protein